MTEMTMQLAGWIVASALLAGAALAAQGDALLVNGTNVNVRAGPTTAAGILTRVGINEPAIERRRQGEWVEVELPDQNVLGWIHGSLLNPAPDQAGAAPDQAGAAQDQDAQTQAAAIPGPATERAQDEAAGDAGSEVAAIEAAATEVTAGTGAAEGGALRQFRSEVAYFNERAVAVAGVDLFTDVASLGEGGVQVVTTDAWATMSEPGQRSYLNALFGRWRAAAGDDQPLRLQIVDSSGALMMEKSGP
jgi:hypothetical protein